KKIEALEVPEMEQAISAYRSVSVSPEFKEMERLRSKARHDEAQALYHAERMGIQQGIQQGMERGLRQGMTARNYDIAQNLLDMNIPVDIIATATNLTPEEIESLMP
ncbi:MAG: hypothetical protein FWH14_05875, partial [Oscillospiraceae bacterium]|nr:hypothetical protein [Oscillospiraceae bacterium]